MGILTRGEGGGGQGSNWGARWLRPAGGPWPTGHQVTGGTDKGGGLSTFTGAGVGQGKESFASTGEASISIRIGAVFQAPVAIAKAGWA